MNAKKSRVFKLEYSNVSTELKKTIVHRLYNLLDEYRIEYIKYIFLAIN